MAEGTQPVTELQQKAGAEPTDKLMMVNAVTGAVQVLTVGQVEDRITAYVAGAGMPGKVEPGATLGEPDTSKIYYVGPGTYNAPSGPISITGNLGMLFWDGSSWSSLEIPVDVDLSPLATKVEFNPVKDYVDNYLKQLFSDLQDETYAFLLKDAVKRKLIMILRSGAAGFGDWIAQNIPGYALKDLAIEYSKLSAAMQQMVWRPLDPESGRAVMLRDANNRLIIDIRTDATAIICGINITYMKTVVDDLVSKVAALSKAKVIEVFGDSLTQGAGGGGTSAPGVLATKLGTGYSVLNAGVGGESVASIAARQGGVPAVITAGFTLPADTSPVVVSSTANKRIKNALYGANVDLLLQGSGGTVNPCYIQDVECTLSYNSGTGEYSLARNVAATNTKQIPANSPITFYGATKYRNPYALIIYMGQNGGFATNAELIEYYKRMVSFAGTANYLVVGLHTVPNDVTPGSGLASRIEMEKAMSDAFGLRYVNLREYMSKYGLIDAGITPTVADQTAMELGKTPPSLLSDSVHFNAAGYTLLGNLYFNRLKQLGII